MTMSIVHQTSKPVTPLIVLHAADAAAGIARLAAPARAWLSANDFKAKAGQWIAVPDASGGLKCIVAAVEDADDVYGLSALPFALPAGCYALSADGAPLNPGAAVLGWGLGAYEFARYRKPRTPATLVIADSPAVQRAKATVAATAAVRDLVNTPAEDMGPQHLSDAARALAGAHGARFREIAGEDLLQENFPAIHAVGRASHRPPRLIELEWGDPSHPRIAMVGKGVCFDTGGLDIKTADGMRQMKKDMGGAANALGMAQLIMALNLPVRLHLVIGAVENAIAGNAYRPGDIVPTRKGLMIEIGNTDAEGRVVLSDAIAFAAESKPQLLIDFATLTGAARVALGPELPATYANDDAWFAKLDAASKQTGDPLWRMPLWQPYNAMIKSSIGDIVNTGGPQAGSVTAALFLEHFVPRDQAWIHIDLFAWTPKAKPGRPEGGEAQTLRAVVRMLENEFAAKP
ncbi:MAG: leucyl aminopeptidase family protein [Betaproteobacteria bacterium]|nr:leucyl aminopeptidase family protein [Betaproteobacteria bacterium]